jgi:Kef-type K+ transport system membrane component KefB
MLSPLFFIGLGGYLNFVANFDGTLLIVILFISIPGKIIGSTLGCLTGGVKAMDSFMVGMLLNARGAMEIILAKQALEYGVIETPLFVALALMAILTSLMSSYGTSYLMSLQKNGKGNPYASSVKPETRQIVTG